MTRRLADFRVLSFDCYGTLIDWETGIWDAIQPLLMANGRGDVLRTAALQVFAGHESDQEARTPALPYRQLLAVVHQAVATHFALDTTEELDQAFGASVPNWPAFGDTADALRYLKTRYRLVVLSNIDRQSFAASSRKLGVDFDAIYTAEDIGSYKPDPANFEHLVARLKETFDVNPADLLHVAQSLFHDHVPAKALGLATAWIDRHRLSQGSAWGATAPVAERPPTDYMFFSLSALAAKVATADRSTEA